MGRWWDASTGCWRDGRGHTLQSLPSFEDLGRLRPTRVVLATAHRDHDTGKQHRQEPRRLLPAVPHEPRSARASASPMADAVPAQSVRRSVSGDLTRLRPDAPSSCSLLADRTILCELDLNQGVRWKGVWDADLKTSACSLAPEHPAYRSAGYDGGFPPAGGDQVPGCALCQHQSCRRATGLGHTWDGVFEHWI